MAAPQRRVSQPVPRLNPSSIEYYKAENAKLRERNASLHRRLHKYKKYYLFFRAWGLFSFVCTLQEDKRKFSFIHKNARYEFPRLLILARSSVYVPSRLYSFIIPHIALQVWCAFRADVRLADAIGTTGQQPAENIPPPNDESNPLYSFDTTDIFPDFDPTTFHIFLQMLARFCIYKPDSINIERIKQIWRISDYFDIPTLLLNEDELVKKIKDSSMVTFQGIQRELDFALRYNWKKLKEACFACIKEKTADFGGLIDNMKNAEIMGLLDMLVVAERRKSGFVEAEDSSMEGEGLEGIRWTTPSDENENENTNGEDAVVKEEMEDDEITDETTMDLVAP